MWVNLVFAIGKNSQLGTLFAIIAKKSFSILEEITINRFCHYVPRRDWQTGDGTNNANFVFRDNKEFIFFYFINKRDQKMKPRAQYPGLHTHFISQGNSASIRHLFAKPSAFKYDDLVTLCNCKGAEQNY